jgi:hypothetical protein
MVHPDRLTSLLVKGGLLIVGVVILLLILAAPLI